LLDQIIRRVRKVSVYEVSIELATLPALTPTWSGPQIDARKLSPAHLIDSYTETLFTQLSKAADAEYAVVDLGAGKEWLTSRLFLFSYILGQTAHLRTFVFLEKAASGRKTFLGISAPSAVVKALATQYPWFEEALLRATVNKTLPAQPSDAPKITRFTGTSGLSIFAPTDWQTLRNIAQTFVSALQRGTEPPDAEKKEHLKLDEDAPTVTWEKTKWIDGDLLERILAGSLTDGFCVESPDTSKGKLAEAILRLDDDLVALVDHRHRFRGLVDRRALASEAWKRRAHQTADSTNESG
jgi:hypothetical protein